MSASSYADAEESIMIKVTGYCTVISINLTFPVSYIVSLVKNYLMWTFLRYYVSISCTSYFTQGYKEFITGDLGHKDGKHSGPIAGPNCTWPLTHYEQFKDATQPTMPVFRLGEKTGVHRPRIWENMQTCTHTEQRKCVRRQNS